MLQSCTFLRPVVNLSCRTQTWFLEILVPKLIPHHADSSFSVTSGGLWPSQFPLNFSSSVLTLNFGALSFKGTTRPFPLPLKNAYFLLLFTSHFLSFHAAKASEKSQFMLGTCLQFGCSSLCCLVVDVYLSRSCFVRFLALIGLKKKERAAWLEGFRVSFSLAHSRGFRALGCCLRQIRHFLCPSCHSVLHLAWPFAALHHTGLNNKKKKSGNSRFL